MKGPVSEQLSVVLGVGNTLGHWVLRVRERELVLLDAVTLPAKVQYGWPHPDTDIWYVSASDGGGRNGPVGRTHALVAYAVHPCSGRFRPVGEPKAIPSRAIHLTVGPAGRYLLAAFNQPAAVRVYTIRSDGSLGDEVIQGSPIDAGNYPHQVRVTPDGRHVLTTALGQDAGLDRVEDPGAVNVFDFEDGRLTNQRRVAPEGGYGFGPRHLDLHPDGSWVFVSLERQNRLDVFEFRDGDLTNSPVASHPLLSAPSRAGVRQIGGTVHVHPAGRVVYGVNRSAGAPVDDGVPAVAGEDSLVVFGVEPATGELTTLQHIETRGRHCRAFHLSSGGEYLIAAHISGASLNDGPGAARELPSLSVFRVSPTGLLAFDHRYLIDTNGDEMFWTAVRDGPVAAEVPESTSYLKGVGT